MDKRCLQSGWRGRVTLWGLHTRQGLKQCEPEALPSPSTELGQGEGMMVAHRPPVHPRRGERGLTLFPGGGRQLLIPPVFLNLLPGPQAPPPGPRP